MNIETTPFADGRALELAINETIIDAANAEAFRDAVRPLLAEHRDLVLDLSRVEFIDSSGLGALIFCLRRATKQGGSFVLHSLQRPVEAMFELVRMHRLFTVYSDRATAADVYSTDSRTPS
jgi:anti-sigma B factor antagonist